MVTEQYERAQDLLCEHAIALEVLANALLAEETLEGGAVQAALHGEVASPAAAVAQR